MRLLVDNKPLGVSRLWITEDIQQFYTTVDFIVICALRTDNVVLETDSKIRLKTLRCTFENDMFHYTCVSEKTFQVINETTKSFCGNATVKQLLSKIGLSNAISNDSISSYWFMPSSKMTTFIDKLNAYAKFARGGAPRFFLNSNGLLTCLDLKQAFTNKSKDSYLSVDSDKSAKDWIIRTPGEVEVYSFCKKECTKSVLSLKEGFGKGSVRVNDTTGYLTDLMKQRITNEFYYNYYTSRELRVNNSQESHKIGDLINIHGVSDFLVVGTTVTCPVTEGSIPILSLRLVAPYE